MSTPTERELLQETLREARGMLGDFRREVRRAERVRDDLTDLVERESEKQVEEHVHVHVRKAAAEVQAETQAAVDGGVEKVNQIFDELAKIVMYGNKQGRGKALAELMREAVRRGA